MKKFAAMVLAATMCFSVVGCSGSQTEVEKIVVPDSAEKFIFNDNAYFELDDSNKLTLYFTSDRIPIEECIYTVAYVVSEAEDSDIEYKISIVLPDGTYDVDLDAKEIDDIGLPEKWVKFIDENGIGDGTHLIQDMISKSTADAIENAVDEKIIKRLANTEDETQTPNIITEKEYTIDGEELTMRIVEKDGELTMAALGNAKTEEKASLMLATLLATFNKAEINNFYISVIVGDLMVVCTPNEDGYQVSGKNKDGSFALSSPDWITSNWTMQEEEIISFSDEILEDMVDFMESANQ